jgi:hypothetical protein
VAFVQRFDSAVRRNVHFHVGWLDGVCSHRLGGDLTWHEDEGVADADVAALVRRIAVRVKQALKKAGKWWGEGAAASASNHFPALRSARSTRSRIRCTSCCNRSPESKRCTNDTAPARGRGTAARAAVRS